MQRLRLPDARKDALVQWWSDFLRVDRQTESRGDTGQLGEATRVR